MQRLANDAAFFPGVRVAVVIPCYRVTRHVVELIGSIGAEVDAIYCVDDACPDGSGRLIEARCEDPRVVVVYHALNTGVGGAVMTGYRRAASDGADVIVKLDGDGQMDPRLISRFVAPIARGEADYTKGNRFYDLGGVIQMPVIRIVGNAVLSFMAKFSTGYWDIFDPTNGYTAIAAPVARALPLDKVSKRYFFETDLLFRLNSLRAVALDVPMRAVYGDETSGLKISRILGEFAWKHLRNACKRVFYNYVLRDLPVATLQLLFGAALLVFGIGFGAVHWWQSLDSGIAATTGTIMVPTISILVGLQLVLAFLAYDIGNIPRRPIHGSLPDAPY